MASVLARQAARSVCLVRPATRAFQSTPQGMCLNYVHITSHSFIVPCSTEEEKH